MMIFTNEINIVLTIMIYSYCVMQFTIMQPRFHLHSVGKSIQGSNDA